MYAISVLSTEYVKVVATPVVGGVAVNPTSDAVSFAIVEAGSQPTTPDWFSGIWEIDATTDPVTYIACGLVGPSGGGHVLTIGRYDVYIRITDAPEVPIKKAGPLRVV